MIEGCSGEGEGRPVNEAWPVAELIMLGTYNDVLLFGRNTRKHPPINPPEAPSPSLASPSHIAPSHQIFVSDPELVHLAGPRYLVRPPSCSTCPRAGRDSIV
jgi:hypothetical protein